MKTKYRTKQNEDKQWKQSTHEKRTMILFWNNCRVAFSKQGFVTLIMAVQKVISQTNKIILKNLIVILKDQLNFDWKLNMSLKTCFKVYKFALESFWFGCKFFKIMLPQNIDS